MFNRKLKAELALHQEIVVEQSMELERVMNERDDLSEKLLIVGCRITELEREVAQLRAKLAPFDPKDRKRDDNGRFIKE